jgi:DNA-binding MarR family transcriptional regulator
MKGAAAALSLAPNTVSTLARNLLRAGLIERRTNPTDSRSALLYLSLAGRRRLRAWRDAREAILAEALERLPENQRNQLERSLRALESLVQEVEA